MNTRNKVSYNHEPVSRMRNDIFPFILFQYLSDNKDKVYIDINDMVGELQARYPDYARRKRNAFKPLVERGRNKFYILMCTSHLTRCSDPQPTIKP